MITLDRALVTLEGRRGLVTGIANDQSIAWGCAKAFRGLGAELAVTYLNEKAKPHVEPLARQLEAGLTAPLDLRREGELEALFAQITERWGTARFPPPLHRVRADGRPAGPRGRLLEDRLPPGHGDLLLVVHPHGQAGRAADGARRHAVLHELLRLADGGRALQPDGAGQGGARERHPLPGGRARPQGHPRPCDLAGPLATRAASGIGHFDELLAKAQAKAPARSLVSIDDVGLATAYLATDAARLITGQTIYVDGGYHIID